MCYSEPEDDEGYYASFWMESDRVCIDCFLKAYNSSPENTFKSLNLANLRTIPWGEQCCVCQAYYWNEKLWKFPIYSGYWHFLYKGDRQFLKRQLEFTKKYPQYQAYWVETSSQAEKINELACERFEGLIDSTALYKVRGNKNLQQDFPVSSWYFSELDFVTHIALVCNCFRFSDYYQVVQDLQDYSQRHFTREESSIISSKLLDILDEILPLFLDMYSESITTEPTIEIADEIRFIQTLFGIDVQSPTFIDPPVAASKNMLNIHFDGLLHLLQALETEGFQLSSVSELSAEHMISKQPDWFAANFHFTKGIFFSDCLLYPQAIYSLTEAIKNNPDFADAYIERAYAYFELGSLDEAIQDYQKSMNLRTIPLVTSKSQFKQSSTHQMIPIPSKKLWQSMTYSHDILCGLGGDFIPKGIHVDSIAYGKGLCEGALEGISLSAIEFCPSVLNTLSGVGQGL